MSLSGWTKILQPFWWWLLTSEGHSNVLSISLWETYFGNSSNVPTMPKQNFLYQLSFLLRSSVQYQTKQSYLSLSSRTRQVLPGSHPVNGISSTVITGSRLIFESHLGNHFKCRYSLQLHVIICLYIILYLYYILIYMLQKQWYTALSSFEEERGGGDGHIKKICVKETWTGSLKV